MGRTKLIYSFSIVYSVYVLGVGGFTLFAALQDDAHQSVFPYVLTILCVTKGAFLSRPAKTIPVIRRIATQSGSGIFRFLFAILMFAPLVPMMIATGVLFWLAILSAVGFFWVFVFPGTAFAGVKSVATKTMTRQELTGLVAQAIRENPTLKVISALNAMVFVTLLLAGLLTHQTIPAPFWNFASVWVALLLAATNLGIMFYPYMLCLPRDARMATYPSWAVFAVLSFAGLSLIYMPVVRDGAANFLASFSGYERAEQFEVLRVRPDSYRKGCSGSLYIRTSTGPIEFCNLKRPFLRNLEGRQYVVVNGQHTVLGLVVSSLEIELEAVTD